MISVIIPTYNNKSVLPRAINSILKQTLQNFEIIVVDDGSSDGTEELFKEQFKSDKIRYERLSVNQGVHAARNRGIELARGDFLIFLDSDDELFPEALEIGLNIMASDNSIGIVSAPFQTDTGELTSFDRNQPGFIDYKDLLCEIGVRRYKTGFVMIRRQIINDFKFIMQNLDFIFYRHLARRAKIYYWPEPLGIYHFSNSEQSLHKKRKIPDVDLSIKRGKALEDFLKEFGDDIIKFCPQNFSYYSYGASVGLLLAGRKKEALQLAKLSIRYNPKKLRYWLFYIVALLPFSPLIMRLLFVVKKFFLKIK